MWLEALDAGDRPTNVLEVALRPGDSGPVSVRSNPDDTVLGPTRLPFLGYVADCVVESSPRAVGSDDDGLTEVEDRLVGSALRAVVDALAEPDRTVVSRSARSQQSTARCKAAHASASRADPSAQIRPTR